MSTSIKKEHAILCLEAFIRSIPEPLYSFLRERPERFVIMMPIDDMMDIRNHFATISDPTDIACQTGILERLSAGESCTYKGVLLLPGYEMAFVLFDPKAIYDQRFFLN